MHAEPAAGPEGEIHTPQPLDYFTEEEMTEWKSYRMKKIVMSMIGMFTVIIFYLTFQFSGFNRKLKTFSERMSERFYTHPLSTRLWTRWPLTRRLVQIPERIFGGKQWVVVVLYIIGFTFLIRFFFLPYSLYRRYWFEIHEGLSNYTLGLWLLDWFKGLFLGTLIYSLMAFGIYGLMVRVGKKWWILLWAGVSIAIFGWALLVPYRSMLYSNFHPLEAGELRTRLETLMQEQDVELEDILVVDASRRTKGINAYVQGTGPTQRIVLYDTILEHFTPREITMIMAHELAHWKEPHKKLQYLFFSLTVFVVLYLANRILEWGSRIPSLNYTSPQDVAGLPFLFFTFFLIFTLIRPVNLFWKRGHELNTDRKSLELVCDPESFVQAHVKLARLNKTLIDPNPLLVYFFYSHPPFLQRIETAFQAECPSFNETQDTKRKDVLLESSPET